VVTNAITIDQSTAPGINQDYSLVSDIPFIPLPDTGNLVMGFEVSSLWQFITGSGTLANITTPKTQGDASMQISGNGYQQIKSIDLKTSKLAENSNLKVDFYVGNTQPNPWWIGYVQLYVNCPSIYMYNLYVGQVMLDGLPRGVFNTLTFALPPGVIATLAGDHDDFSFSWALNTNAGSGPYYFDNMRFSN
jgi:hypothetical protein